MRLSGFTLPVQHVSASSLAKGAVCPEQWRRKYLLKEPETTYADMFLGTVTHAVAEENWYHKLGTGKDLDWKELLHRYDSIWDNKLEKEKPEWLDKDPDEIQSLGVRMAKAYHEEAVADVMPVRIEERFEEVIRGIPFPIIGYMDVVTPDRVIDQKTSKSKVTTAKSNWRFQARVYELVTDLPTEWHVVTSQAEPKVYTAKDSPGLFMGKGNADATITMIKQTIERLNDCYVRYGPDSSWPTEGVFHVFACNRCFAKDHGCPAWKPKGA